MKWLESRILWGGLLVFGGVLFLLQNLNVIAFGDIFWAALFGLAGAFFVSIVAQNRANWWALIPAFILFGIAFQILFGVIAPGLRSILGGGLVLGGLGLGFIIIYLLNREHWWAIIPAGVMFTLAVVTILGNSNPELDTGAAFFFGLGATFALVALAPSPSGPMLWAWAPAGILLLMGIFVLFSALDLMAYLFPLALILAGGYLIVRTFAPRTGR
jgi:hypothetical protein